jgi:hypothetical protein
MITSLWLALLFAQPATPGPGAPAAPAPPAASGPAEAAPPEPAASATAPAAAAPGSQPPAAPPPQPPTPAPPPPQDASPLPREACVFGGLVYRSGTLPPRAGFSLAGSFQSRYATLPAGLELGWAFDFAYASFSQAIEANLVSSQSQSTFGLLQTAALHAGAFRYWLGVGGGLMIANQDKAPFARAAAGADLPFDQQTGVQLRVGYAHMLTSSTAQSGDRTYDRIGNPLDIHAGLFYRFR